MDIRIGLVDDHKLFSKSLELMLMSFKKFTVIVEASNGLDLQKKMNLLPILPDIMLIDVNMPEMNGFQTATWLKGKFPTIKLAALSMSDGDQSIIEMFKAGCCAYLFKDISPAEFQNALLEIYNKGYYNSDQFRLHQGRLLNSERPQFNDKEVEFLNLACSDMTYRKISEIMKLSERKIETYRETLFKKLEVESRTGMALEAIRRGLVKI